MTTHDQHTEATHTLEEVEPATATTEHPTGQTDSSTVGADPSTAQTESTNPEGEPSAVGADAGRHAEVEGSVTNQTQSPVAHSEPSTTPPESAIAGTEAPAGMTEPARAEAETTTERSLFADNELAGLRARWENVQGGFVDDPRECVQKADGLVSDLVDQLTTGFTEARSRLEEQWARGEEASTEDLRLALKRYREFFERLLAV
jgi:hypothetical protein